MNHPLIPKSLLLANRYRPNKSTRGIALILVLAIIVLVSALVVGFLTLATSERQTSAAYAHNVETRMLSESAADLVMGQIRNATSNLGNTKTWASQPGMIRVYGIGNGTSHLVNAYKLYSSDKMVDGAAFDPTNEVPPTTWSQTPAVYTDLNQPVNGIYPIIDGNNLESYSGAGIDKVAGGGQAKTYINPNTGKPAIAGFSVVNAPVAKGASPNPVPMPVKWLYVLKDGTYVAPTLDGADVKIPGSSADNPVVGRIAFWTDDETSKVNINTAGEGQAWYSPHTTSIQDYTNPLNPTSSYGAYGLALPIQNEFSQYPGDPAQTCLSTVLSSWLPMAEPPNPWNASSNYRGQLQAYMTLLPRLQYGGSQGGTFGAAMNTSPPAVILDQDRRFANVDELFFRPSSTGDIRDTASSGIPKPPNDFIQKSKFFLTASSRAPEVTLFNTPRMSLWPLQSSKAERNAIDGLQAFCSQIGGTSLNPYIYYLQRLNSYSTVLGNGSTASAQSMTMDWNNITRNQTLYKYIQALTKNPIPGFSNSSSDTLQNKYKQKDTDQIELSIFDYIRSNVNLSGVNSSTGGTLYSYAAKIQSNVNDAQAATFGFNCVVPLEITPPGGSSLLKGYGRFLTITQAALVFYAEGDHSTDTTIPEGTVKVGAVLLLQPFTVTPSYPLTSNSVSYQITGADSFQVFASTKPTGSAKTQSLGFASSMTDISTGPYWTGQNDKNDSTAAVGITAEVMEGNGGTPKTVSATPNNTDSTFPFVINNPLYMTSGSDGTFAFTGGTINVSVTVGYDNNKTVQTLHMKFPDGDFPIPKVANDHSLLTFNQRIHSHLNNNEQQWRRSNWIQEGDTVRAVQVDPKGPSKGDYRLIAAMPDVPADYFAPNVNYNNQSVKEAMSLRLDIRLAQGQYGQMDAMGNLGVGGIPGGTPPAAPVYASDQSINGGKPTNNGFSPPDTRIVSGSLVSSPTGSSKPLDYGPWAAPEAPQGLIAALNADGRPGDWDNGIAFRSDGPLINPPDAFNALASYANPSGGGGTEAAALVFSHQIASAVQFGSIPTGVYGDGGSSPRPWQTLLFCPNPPSRQTAANQPPKAQDHFGFGNPPDHLWLGLFTMPVVQPYAISEPLSTAGKINMNYQIMPFTYIDRSTGIRAVLKNQRILAIPDDAVKSVSAAGSPPFNTVEYKQESGIYFQPDNGNPTNDPWSSQAAPVYPYELYYDVDPDKTLEGFQERFAKNDIFHSASEICDIFLAPKTISGAKYTPAATARNPDNVDYDGLVQWWNGSPTTTDAFELTGDNSREQPYASIYPRLTTKSNSYKVYVRVQALRQTPDDAKTRTWTEGKDQILGEYRGSYLIERYVDPNDQDLPDFAANLQSSGSLKSGDSPTTSLDDYYRFRVLERKQFNP